jgi:hypothetical protein
MQRNSELFSNRGKCSIFFFVPHNQLPGPKNHNLWTHADRDLYPAPLLEMILPLTGKISAEAVIFFGYTLGNVQIMRNEPPSAVFGI